MEAEQWRRTTAEALAGDAGPLRRLAGAERRDYLEWMAERHLAGLLLSHCAALLADSEIATMLAALARREVVVSALQEQELRRLLDGFAAARCPLVLLKGCALAYTAYAQAALRPRNDADFLIRGGDEAAVRGILDALGYQPSLETPGRLVSNQFHYERIDASGLRHVCDVHVKLSNSQPYAEFLTFDRLWQEAVPVPALHPAARAPWPGHALLIACVHRIAHHYDTTDLIWLWDIRLLARRLDAGGWDAVLARSRSETLSAIVQRGLEQARDVLGDSVCAAHVDAFRRAAALESAPLLFGPDTRTLDVVSADLAALAPRAKIQLLRQHLLPPLAYLRQRYPACPRVLLPLAWVYRVVHGAPKWLARSGR